MKKVLVAGSACLAIGMTALYAHAGVSFPAFKFQPEARYEISIEQQGKISSRGAQAFPGDIRQDFSARIVVETGAQETGRIPLKMIFEDVKMEMTRGDSKIPFSLPKDARRRLDGWLAEDGRVEVSGGTEPLALFQARGVDVLKLLDFIPDMPEGEFDVGDRFEVRIPEGKARCRIKSAEGDEVVIEAKWSKEFSDTTGASVRESKAGATGEIRYSKSQRICRSITSETTVNTVLRTGERKIDQGVVTQAHLEIKVKRVR